MLYLHKSCACLAIVYSAIVLSACSPEANTTLNYLANSPLKYPTNTPSKLRTISNEALSVDVQIDNTGPIYKGEKDENGNWTVDLIISRDTTHSFVAKWFAMVRSQRLLVLEQRGNFYADSTNTRAEPTQMQSISSGEAQFDFDCDDISNLAELMNPEDDPLSLPGCGSSATPDTTNTTNTTGTPPQNTISTNIPDVMQLTAGCFNMGSPEFYPEGSGQINVVRKPDERQHEVCVERFSIGIYEVTQAQWSRFDNGRRINNFPIRNITREQADEYTTWLSNETGDTYRLPTEAEWEYAARGGTKTRFWSGDKLADNQENFVIRNSHLYGGAIETAERLELPAGILPVGSLQSNPYGLYDMLSNAMEHTCSAYSENYDPALALETFCSADPSTKHVYRSGDQNRDVTWARSAVRTGTLEYTQRDGGVGFRVVKENR